MTPVTVNMGMSMPSWYDIKDLGGNRAEESADGIEDSVFKITSIMEKAHKEDGIAYKNMVLGGFSQVRFIIFCILQ